MPSSYARLNLVGKTVFTTGATAGIGRATALRFAELGCKLVLCGRRAERLRTLTSEICSSHPACPVPLVVELDVQDVKEILNLPVRLAAAGVTAVDILVNNAGVALGTASALDNDVEDMKAMLATNALAPMCLVGVFGPGMRERGWGHIVNICSVAGHESYAGGSVYCATKHAMRSFTDAMRHDLAATPIRVTSISPGLVHTEFSKVRYHGDDAKASQVYDGIVPMVAADVADQIIYATTAPKHVQIADIISYATNQGHAKYVLERQGPDLGAQKGAL